MCGEGCVEKMCANWMKYVPKLLALEKSYVHGTPIDHELLELTEGVHQKALLILDKKLRSGGPSAKFPAVFSIFEVHNYYTHSYMPYIYVKGKALL